MRQLLDDLGHGSQIGRILYVSCLGGRDANPCWHLRYKTAQALIGVKTGMLLAIEKASYVQALYWVITL